MRIELVAPPMHGHLNPILGIAQRLSSEPGLSVRVLSSPAATMQIQAAGLEPIALLDEAAAASVGGIVDPGHAIRSHPGRLLHQLRASVRLQLSVRSELDARWRQEPPDLVIADFTMPAAGLTATDLGVPWWTTHPSPCVIEAATGPPAYLGGWAPGQGWWGRSRDAAGRQAVRTAKRTAYRIVSRGAQDLGIPGVYRRDGSETVYSPQRIFALFPPQLEFPREMPAAVRHVGPVLYTPVRPGQGVPEVDPGRPSVLVTAGTHLHWHKQGLLGEVAVAAAALPEVDFHFSLGGTEPQAPHRGVKVHSYLDYARDLAKFDAVVHHGGSGVLSYTVAAGLPAVVRPVDYDQFDHAARLVAAGVALWPRRREPLASAVRRLLDEPAYREAAQRVGQQLRQAPAVERIAAEVAAMTR